ncbi:MAG TPA: hypothetical protein VJB16_04515, partial [archaeon]|nr:hypothetical protein [archaeon]
MPHLVDGSLQEHQVGILVNALVLASNSLPLYGEQAAFLETLCRPFLDALLTPTLQTGLASPAEFAAFHCLADDTLLRVGPGDERLARLGPLRTLLAVLTSAWRNVRLPQTDEEVAARRLSGLAPGRSVPLRARHPLASQLPQLLPFVLSTLRTLHAFSLVHVQSSFVPVPVVRAVFDKPDRVSVEGELGAHDGFDLEVETDSGGGVHLPASLVAVRRHMQRLRVALYTILGAMTNAAEFYMVDNIGEHIVQSVLVNIDSIHNYDLLRLMQSALLPLASNCPNTEVRESMLGRTLPPLLAFLQHRLNPLWAQLLSQSEELAQVTASSTKQALAGGSGGDSSTGLSKAQKKRLKKKSKSVGSSPSPGVQAALAAATSAATMTESSLSVEQELAMEELVRLLSRALADWMRRTMVSSTQPE